MYGTKIISLTPSKRKNTFKSQLKNIHSQRDKGQMSFILKELFQIDKKDIKIIIMKKNLQKN